MYAKLALRNAKRSAGDYLLYIITLVVLSALMMFSNLLAVASSQKGLQASSVPLLIALVMVFLFGYINGYMLRRRAKEFATYLLLGMRNGRMAAVFFGESLLLGAAGLVLGMAVGGLLFPLALSFLRTWFPISGSMEATYGKAALDTGLYFLAVQALSLLGCVRKIRKLQINSLLSEGRRNQALRSKPRPVFWFVLFAICTVADLVLITFITGGDTLLMMLGVNTIILPLVLGTWAFYKAAFHLLAWLRLHRRSDLYRGNRLYVSAQLLSKITSNVTLNTVLSLCLLFSALAFSVGVIMPNLPGGVFAAETAIWMSFSEICLSVVFLAIYFSILAVRQIVEAKENHHAFRVMTHLGQTGSDLKRLVGQEIVLKYALPAVMCLLVLSLCIGPVNVLLNGLLPAKDLPLMAVGCFAGCFLLLYAGYSLVAYRLCIKQLAHRR